MHPSDADPDRRRMSDTSNTQDPYEDGGIPADADFNPEEGQAVGDEQQASGDEPDDDSDGITVANIAP
jgi:hypothetical protein